MCFICRCISNFLKFSKYLTERFIDKTVCDEKKIQFSSYLVYNLWQCMKWHELNHVIDNRESGAVAKFLFWIKSFGCQEWRIPENYIQWKSFVNSNNDLLRRITSCASSFVSLALSLFFVIDSSMLRFSFILYKCIVYRICHSLFFFFFFWYRTRCAYSFRILYMFYSSIFRFLAHFSNII